MRNSFPYFIKNGAQIVWHNVKNNLQKKKSRILDKFSDTCFSNKIANFDPNFIDLKGRSCKSKQLTLNQRDGIVQILWEYKKGEKLQHGAINIVAFDFEVSRLTVLKIYTTSFRIRKNK